MRVGSNVIAVASSQAQSGRFLLKGVPGACCAEETRRHLCPWAGAAARKALSTEPERPRGASVGLAR